MHEGVGGGKTNRKSYFESFMAKNMKILVLWDGCDVEEFDRQVPPRGKHAASFFGERKAKMAVCGSYEILLSHIQKNYKISP
jgi:hypothetical protein